MGGMLRPVAMFYVGELLSAAYAFVRELNLRQCQRYHYHWTSIVSTFQNEKSNKDRDATNVHTRAPGLCFSG